MQQSEPSQAAFPGCTASYGTVAAAATTSAIAVNVSVAAQVSLSLSVSVSLAVVVAIAVAVAASVCARRDMCKRLAYLFYVVGSTVVCLHRLSQSPLLSSFLSPLSTSLLQCPLSNLILLRANWPRKICGKTL